MKLRLARPATLVDIGRLDDLRGVRDAGDHLAIGGLTRHHDLNNDPLARQHCPLIAYTAGLVGDPQVRHRGTIGGSLAHGDPASDLPTICLALDAVIVARGPGGERHDRRGRTSSTASSRRPSPRTRSSPRSACRRPAAPGWSYLKFRQRALDWADRRRRRGGRREQRLDPGRARSALTNMGQTPLRASRDGGGPRGRAPRRGVAGGRAADEGTDPPSDTWASAGLPPPPGPGADRARRRGGAVAMSRPGRAPDWARPGAGAYPRDERRRRPARRLRPDAPLAAGVGDRPLQPALPLLHAGRGHEVARPRGAARATTSSSASCGLFAAHGGQRAPRHRRRAAGAARARRR